MDPATCQEPPKKRDPQDRWVAGWCFQSGAQSGPQGEGQGGSRLPLLLTRLGCGGPTTAQGGECRQEAVGV